MKVLITLSYYLPNISGLTIYARNLAEELVKEGNDVRILTSWHLKNLPPEEKINRVLVKRIWTPFSLGRGPIMPTYFWESYKNIINSDVVNIHLPQFEGFIGAITSKLSRRKLIITYHCDLSFWGGILNVVSTTLVYLSNFISCVLAEKIVVNSKDYADSSFFLKFFRNKLVYIYPPVRIEKAKSGVLGGYKNIKYKIGYVGRISKEKGVECLLESIKYLKGKLPSFKTFLVGPKDDVIGGTQEHEIKDLLEKYKSNVILLGKLTDEELSGFYKEINCLVLPSTERQESFGMVQVEAMLSGCPVVASDLPGVRVPVQLTKMGELFAARNSQKLAGSVINVLKTKIRKTKDMQKLDYFNRQNSVKKYEEIFKSISL